MSVKPELAQIFDLYSTQVRFEPQFLPAHLYDPETKSLCIPSWLYCSAPLEVQVLAQPFPAARGPGATFGGDGRNAVAPFIIPE